MIARAFALIAALNATAPPAQAEGPPPAAPVTAAVPAGPVPAEAIARCEPVLAAPATQSLRARSVELLRSRHVDQPVAWSRAVQLALCAVRLPVSAENMALVLALVERESSFHARALLPGHPEGFRTLGYRLIDDVLAADTTDLERVLGREAAARLVAATLDGLQRIGLVDRTALRRQFDRLHERFRWHRVATEWDVEQIVARDLLTLADETSPPGLLLRGLLAWEPRWREMLRGGQIFRTVGPLQVGPEHAVRLAAQDGRTIDEAQARQWLYTIDGGVYYGLRLLRAAIASHTGTRPLDATAAGFVAADWRHGLYSSRDAAAVAAIARLAGRTLPPETRLRSQAVRELLLALGPEAGMTDGGQASAAAAAASAHAQRVQAMLSRAGQPGLEHDPLFQQLQARHRSRFGQDIAPAAMPQARFYSAKTGRYTLVEIVDDTRRRFRANCARLGCRGAAS